MKKNLLLELNWCLGLKRLIFTIFGDNINVIRCSSCYFGYPRVEMLYLIDPFFVTELVAIACTPSSSSLSFFFTPSHSFVSVFFLSFEGAPTSSIAKSGPIISLAPYPSRIIALLSAADIYCAIYRLIDNFCLCTQHRRVIYPSLIASVKTHLIAPQQYWSFVRERGQKMRAFIKRDIAGC